MDTWPICPKCRAKADRIVELWTATIEWGIGEQYFNSGQLNPGDPFKVEAHCKVCNKTWTVRGVVQAQPEWFKGE